MFSGLSLSIARRAIAPSLLPRALLTRQISSTPEAFSPPKAKAGALATKSETKSKTTKSVAKKPKKAEKNAEKPAFSREQLKVPPRPSPSAYVMFTKLERAKLPKPASIEDSIKLTKDLGEKWHTLTAEEKKVYEDKTVEHNAEIARVYNEWIDNVDPAVLREINKRRKAHDKRRIVAPRKGPKRPTPAFFRFLDDFRNANSSIPLLESAKQAGVAWRELSEAKKEEYLDAFAVDLKAYHIERDAYNAAQQSL